MTRRHPDHLPQRGGGARSSDCHGQPQELTRRCGYVRPKVEVRALHDAVRFNTGNSVETITGTSPAS